ncbi:MAG: hypothetical protein AAGK37_15715 [Pseudomonadota bacterium]
MTASKLGILALVIVAACATPAERCVSKVSRELNTVNALIAETEENLARGYRIETEVDYIPQLTFCTGFGRGFGTHSAYGGVNFCQGTRRVERERQVAIDPLAERRKLANLENRRAALQGPTEKALGACQSAS